MNARLLPTFAAFLLWGTAPLRAQTAFREQPSLTEAARYLHERTEWWLTWKRAEKENGTVCMSCHTTVPYLLARSVLDLEPIKDDPRERLLKSVRQRVKDWETGKPYTASRPAQSRGSESILNLLALALDDASAKRKEPSEDTRRALANLWSQQIKPTEGKDEGGWEWIEAGLSPWESRANYFGAALAAFAVATVPGYLTDAPPQDRKQLDLFRNYLQAHFPKQNLHDRLTLAWASGRWPELLSAEGKQQLFKDILAKQNDDGGWSAGSLVEWKRPDGKAHATVSDGYGTALVVAALKQLAKDQQRKPLEQGIAWLKTHQTTDGTWQAQSLNRDYAKGAEPGLFMTDAATGWAIWALAE
jgi:squalene-hopene/tetraprenyl-beta-curcumene cyclase